MKKYQLYLLSEEHDDSSEQWYKLGSRSISTGKLDSFNALLRGNYRRLLIRWYVLDSKFYIEELENKIIMAFKEFKIRSRYQDTALYSHKTWFYGSLTNLIQICEQVHETQQKDYQNTNFSELFEIN